MRTLRGTALGLAALASMGAGVVHAAVVVDHARSWWVSGVFFAQLAAFQLGWGALALLRPADLLDRGRRSLSLVAAAIAVNAGTAVLWR